MKSNFVPYSFPTSSVKMHWSSNNQRSFSSKNSTRKASAARGTSGMRTGTGISSSKPIMEATSSRNSQSKDMPPHSPFRRLQDQLQSGLRP